MKNANKFKKAPFYKIAWKIELLILISLSPLKAAVVIRTKATKIDVLVKNARYSKGGLHAVKNFHTVKFFQIVKLYKSFQNLSSKVSFFIRLFAKVLLKLEKSFFRKWQKSIYNGPHIVNRTFTWPKFTRSLLSLVHITHNIKRKYLTLIKLQRDRIFRFKEPWIGTEYSGFQVNFRSSKVVFSNWYFEWHCYFILHLHCVKSVQIRSFFWSVFSHIRARKNSVFWHFSHSANEADLYISPWNKIASWTACNFE